MELYGPGYSALEHDSVSTTTLYPDGLQGQKLLTKRTSGICKLVARLLNNDPSPIGVPSMIVPSCTTGIVFEAGIA